MYIVNLNAVFLHKFLYNTLIIKLYKCLDGNILNNMTNIC